MALNMQTAEPFGHQDDHKSDHQSDHMRSSMKQYSPWSCNAVRQARGTNDRVLGAIRILPPPDKCLGNTSDHAQRAAQMGVHN